MRINKNNDVQEYIWMVRKMEISLFFKQNSICIKINSKTLIRGVECFYNPTLSYSYSKNLLLSSTSIKSIHIASIFDIKQKVWQQEKIRIITKLAINFVKSKIALNGLNKRINIWNIHIVYNCIYIINLPFFFKQIKPMISRFYSIPFNDF